MLSVSEFGRIYRSDTDGCLPDGNLKLSKRHFSDLMSVLESDDEEAPDYSPILSYLRPGGVEQLRVQNYVGVIRLADGTQIEVLPKLSKKLAADKARALLVKMLIELEDSPFLEGTAADLDAHEMPLFELLLRCYLDRVAIIVRKGIARTYVQRQNNLIFLRGKLDLTEHIKRNSYNASRVYCQYDEYEADRPINRLVKGALQVVARVARDATNQQRCRELLYWFDQVPGTRDPRSDFRAMRRDRLVQHYAPAMSLCRLILEKLNPLTKKGDNRAVSMLFPMETVFEAYVAAKLKKQLSGWMVSAQVSGEALIEDHLGRKVFQLKPDLVISRSTVRVIADTKWKLLDEVNKADRYGISQTDVYQLFGYAEKYLGNQAHREVILIYPACDSFSNPLAPFWYRKDSQVLFAVPYDLEGEYLNLPLESLLRNENAFPAAS